MSPINRVVMLLEQTEYTALLNMSVVDLRSPAAEARYIVRNALHERGFLSNTDMSQLESVERPTQPRSIDRKES